MIGLLLRLLPATAAAACYCGCCLLLRLLLLRAAHLLLYHLPVAHTHSVARNALTAITDSLPLHPPPQSRAACECASASASITQWS